MHKLLDVGALKNVFMVQVWQTPLDDMAPAREKLVIALRILHLVIRDLIDGMITLRAMGLVYTTILALVPLLAVSFSVLKGFGVHNQIEPMLYNMLAPLGDKGVEISERIIAFVDNTRAGVLGGVGLALLLYTVVSLLQKIERAFNYTWRVNQHRSITQRFSDYLSIILVGPVLLFTALGITASLSSVTLIQDLMQIEAVGVLVKLGGRLLPYLLVIIAFTFVYMLVPNIRVQFRSALIGGVVAGVLWATTSWVFSAFIVNSAKYTAIYSAFASLIIFFIWIYLNWLILLIGCSIASYHQQPAQRTLHSRMLRLSNRLRERMALLIMVHVARHFHEHRTAWSCEEMAKKINVQFDACNLMMTRLVSAGLLVTSSDTPERYLPAYDPATMHLADIVNAVRASGESGHMNVDSLDSDAAVDDVCDAMESAMTASFKQQSLLDLALHNADLSQ